MSDRAPLIPPALRATMPGLYATDRDPDPTVRARLFTPWTNWTWFILEFDGEDRLFGLVSGHEVELGDFSLAELEAIEGPGGLRIERDIHFIPKPLSELRTEIGRQRALGWKSLHDPGNPPCREFNAEAQSKGTGGQALLFPSNRSPKPPAALFPSPLEAPAIKMLETGLSSVGTTHPSVVLTGSRSAAAVLHDLVGGTDREHFVALYLNVRHELTHAHVVSCGTTQQTLVHPREVFKAAVLSNAAAMVVGHNHPSGDVRPSLEDRAVFERLQRVGEIMGIDVIDSVIVGPKGWFYAAANDEISQLSPNDLADDEARGSENASHGPSRREVALEELCRGLLRDIDDVVERQGEGWWEETVSSGTRYRNLAGKSLDPLPYKPRPKDAGPTPTP